MRLLYFLILANTFSTVVALAASRGQLSVSQQPDVVIVRAACVALQSLKLKDEYTYGHSMRVGAYAAELGKDFGFEPKGVERLRVAAAAHDLGKIGIEDAVLQKPGKLTELEYQVMKSHPVLGATVLHAFEPHVFVETINLAILYHHERFDAKGYPKGLKGDAIPLFARLISIADTYDAMTTTRVYRKALPIETAIEEVKKNAGTQFDPALVEVFLRSVPKWPGLVASSVSIDFCTSLPER
jgi:HD-GYP domain-containing protein (c-di-GMP phosphodiesterase class II)